MSAVHETRSRSLHSLMVDKETASFVVSTKFWDNKIFINLMPNYWNYWEQHSKILDSRLSRQWRYLVCGIWIMTPCSLARSSYVECHITEIHGVAVGTCEKARQQKTKQVMTCRPREREVCEGCWWECLIFIHELF